jgi:flagellar hook-associated protein 2
VGSPITFNGFNNIDFSVVLTAIMTQESQPLTLLQDRQTDIQSKITNFATLATKTATLEGAAAALSTASSLAAFSATSTDPAAVGVSSLGTAVAGHYDIKVLELARAQVTASSSWPDATTTPVATGGALTIDGVDVPVTATMTLADLASAINADANLAATAAVVQDGAASFRLVLTAKATGADNGFAVTSTLSGTSLTFAGANAIDPTDASLLVNNIPISSASNTLDTVIPGSSMTLYKKDPNTIVGVDIAPDSAALKSKLSGFILAYNDLVKFAGAQTTAANNGDTASIGRDPLVRQLRNTLRSALSASYGADGTNNLSQAGVEFVKNTGTLTLKDAAFATAVANGSAGLSALFAGTSGTPGVFASISSMLDVYTQTSGILSSVQTQLNTQLSSMSNQVARMQDRLAIRRASLQKEFTAADTAMTQLKNQSSSLSSLIG